MFQLFMGVLIPFFTDWGKITFAQVMILNAFFKIIIVIFEVPTGAIADRFGRKTSLVLSGIALTIATIIYGLYPSFWIFMLGELFWGIGFALFSGADQALVYDSLVELGEEKRSKKIFGLWHSMGFISVAIAAPLGSLIAKYMGPRYTVLLMAIPMFLASLVAITLREPRVGQSEKTIGYLRTIREGLAFLRRHRVLKILTFDYISISAFVFFIVWVYQVILKELAVPIEWFGFVASGITLVQVVAVNLFSKLDSFFGGKRRYIYFSALISGGAFIGLAFTHNTFFTIVLTLVIATFGLTRQPLFLNYMNKFIPSHNRATVLSAVSMIFNLSAALIYVLLGFLADLNMQLSLILIGCVVLALASFSKIEEEHLLD